MEELEYHFAKLADSTGLYKPHDVVVHIRPPIVKHDEFFGSEIAVMSHFIVRRDQDEDVLVL